LELGGSQHFQTNPMSQVVQWVWSAIIARWKKWAADGQQIRSLDGLFNTASPRQNSKQWSSTDFHTWSTRLFMVVYGCLW
jgi:hypothetical protein